MSRPNIHFKFHAIPALVLFLPPWKDEGTFDATVAEINQGDARGKHLPGDKGGETMLAQSTTRLSVASTASFMAMPSRPENMGFIGVCSMSQALGLPTVLPEADRGGVEGKYGLSPNSASSIMCLRDSGGVLVGVMTEGPLL